MREVRFISHPFITVTGENHEALPGCNRSRLQEMSRFFSVPSEKSDRRLHSTQENKLRETDPEEDQVTIDINMVV